MPFKTEIEDRAVEFLQRQLGIDQRQHGETLEMLGIFSYGFGDAVVDDPAHLGAFFGREAVDAGMGRGQDLHVDAVFFDAVDAHVDVEKIRD